MGHRVKACEAAAREVVALSPLGHFHVVRCVHYTVCVTFDSVVLSQTDHGCCALPENDDHNI